MKNQTTPLSEKILDTNMTSQVKSSQVKSSQVKSSQVKSGHSLLMENFTPFFTYFVECKPGNMDRNGV